MKVAYQQLLAGVKTQSSGRNAIRMRTNNPVTLWTKSESEGSGIIRLAGNYFVLHLQPGDIIVEGKYTNSRKLLNIDSLESLQKCTIVRLEETNNYTTLQDIPTGYKRVSHDASFGNLTNHILAALNGLDTLIGVNCHSETHINIVSHRLKGDVITAEDIKDGFKKLNSNESPVKGISNNVYYNFNQFTGKFDILVLVSNDKETNEYQITKGISVQCKNHYKSLEVVIDLKVLGFSDYIINHLNLSKTAS